MFENDNGKPFPTTCLTDSLLCSSGTRVYVRLNPKWQGRTKGLCGDYNNNAEDDFKTPSGGIPEVSANLFGDSWKKQTSCPESKEITDTCLANLERKTWAKKKCGLLKSPLFQACHSEVEVEPYLERCVFDTCGCDVGKKWEPVTIYLITIYPNDTHCFYSPRWRLRVLVHGVGCLCSGM